MKHYTVIIVLYCLIKCGTNANVLVLHPFYGGSHILTLRRLAEALAERDHEVTIIRWLDINVYTPVTNPKLDEWVLSVNNSDNSIPLVTHEERGRFNLPIKRMWEQGLKPTLFPLDGYLTVAYYCKALLENEVLIEHLRNKKFKVAIVDLVFNDCGLALSHELGVPAIGFWGFNFASGYAISSTAFNPPSALPQTFSNLKDEMNFMERVTNTVYYMAIGCLMQVQYAVANHAIQRVFPHSPYPSELVANMSGVLINSHPAVDYPRLLPPSYIEVAGMHMRPKNALPTDISNFMDSSGDAGVILFSLGFNFDAKYIPSRIFSNYFKAFGKLKQKVIVKAKGRPPYVPPNVKIYPFFPQADILAHNKTVLFISHCGIHGVMEAIEHKVPLVGIPIFVDQRDNLLRLVQHGVAKALDKEASQEQIYEAVLTVLNDTRYKENMKQLSKRVKAFGDPLQKALWLVEHVMETDGAEHLKLASRHLGILQYLCVDVILFLVGSAISLFCVLHRIFSKISQSLRDENCMKLKMS